MRQDSERPLWEERTAAALVFGRPPERRFDQPLSVPRGQTLSFPSPLLKWLGGASRRRPWWAARSVSDLRSGAALARLLELDPLVATHLVEESIYKAGAPVTAVALGQLDHPVDRSSRADFLGEDQLGYADT